MPEESSVRIDKFLWAVRIYKTRSIAAEECKRGRITINGIQVKPSRSVMKNEIIIVRKMHVIYSYRVIEPIEKRVSAKLASGFIEDLTPDEEKRKLELKQSDFSGYRERGTGRPTKKERRNLDRLRMDLNDW
ncbi:MAG: RNA-binding S4 domain-containing protein [Bacteroidales bacterium]|nr:RNA-binding S4 domain-containing protein [Bacteroidales bacterium]